MAYLFIELQSAEQNVKGTVEIKEDKDETLVAMLALTIKNTPQLETLISKALSVKKALEMTINVNNVSEEPPQ